MYEYSQWLRSAISIIDEQDSNACPPILDRIAGVPTSLLRHSSSFSSASACCLCYAVETPSPH